MPQNYLGRQVIVQALEIHNGDEAQLASELGLRTSQIRLLLSGADVPEKIFLAAVDILTKAGIAPRIKREGASHSSNGTAQPSHPGDVQRRAQDADAT